MHRLTEIGGKRLPFLRWSVLRFTVSLPRFLKTWQVGDGREEALAHYVIDHARSGDVGDAIRAVDEFCYEHSFMVNVGDEKGALLDAAIERCKARQLLELGTYCGYSALRTARLMPGDADAIIEGGDSPRDGVAVAGILDVVEFTGDGHLLNCAGPHGRLDGLAARP